MDERNDIMGMLDLMVCPGFCVKNQKIEKLNPAASSCTDFPVQPKCTGIHGYENVLKNTGSQKRLPSIKKKENYNA